MENDRPTSTAAGSGHAEAGRWRIKEEQIRGILEHQKYGINVYRALNRALAKLASSAVTDAARG